MIDEDIVRLIEPSPDKMMRIPVMWIKDTDNGRSFIVREVHDMGLSELLIDDTAHEEEGAVFTSSPIIFRDFSKESIDRVSGKDWLAGNSMLIVMNGGGDYFDLFAVGSVDEIIFHPGFGKRSERNYYLAVVVNEATTDGFVLSALLRFIEPSEMPVSTFIGIIFHFGGEDIDSGTIVTLYLREVTLRSSFKSVEVTRKILEDLRLDNTSHDWEFGG